MGVEVMRIELTDRAIIDFFKEKASEMNLDERNREFIRKNIDKLIDSKIARFQKAVLAGELWKIIAYESIKSITKNIRGYAELCKYIDSYIKYEDLLFSIDEQYRDHIIHSIWVMLLGLYLRDKCDVFRNLDYSNQLVTQKDFNEEFGELVEETRKYEEELWCLIALTHDLGYPIEKTRMVNEMMRDMINRFGFLKLTDFEYNFTVVHQATIESLLNTLSSRLVCDLGNAKVFKVLNFLGTKTEYAKSFERLDHGIMSAYLLQNYLDFICEETRVPSGLESIGLINASEVSKIVVTWTLISAISAHTNVYSYYNKIDNINALLILCDELEEFSRYSRNKSTNEWVEVYLRTVFEYDGKSLKLEYVIDKGIEEWEMEEFFKKKVRNINGHFEADEEGLNKIIITCKDLTKAKNIECKFEKECASESEPNRITAERVIGEKHEDMTDFINELIGYDTCKIIYEGGN